MSGFDPSRLSSLVALLVLTVFSFISSKLVTYTVTGAPWLAAGIGGCLKTTKGFRPQASKEGSLRSGRSLCVDRHVAPEIRGQPGSQFVVPGKWSRFHEDRGKTWICDRFLPGMEFYAENQSTT